jgi:hypothetical protein
MSGHGNNMSEEHYLFYENWHETAFTCLERDQFPRSLVCAERRPRKYNQLNCFPFSPTTANKYQDIPLFSIAIGRELKFNKKFY